MHLVMIVKKKIKSLVFCLFIGLVLIGSFLVWGGVFNETEDVLSPSIESNLDPSKPATDCAGNYLYYVDVYEYANILERTYDLYDLETLAISNGFDVILTENWSYIDNWDVDGFNENYGLGFELKKGDRIDQGPIKIIVSDEGIVKIFGNHIIIKKTISEDEIYGITIRYEPDYYLKQSMQVVQNGKCNLKDSYVKTQVKNALEQLYLETAWVDKSTVEVNHLFSIE